MLRLNNGLVLILSLVLIGCASSIDNQEAMARYQFPELESVSSINNWKLDGWEVIDQQSLIIQTGPSQFYLFVLSRRHSQLRFAESILVTSTAGRVKVNFDTVSTPRDPMLKVPIAAMYKLQGREAVAAIKQQILAE
ncbi:DUF6491 family protein [Oceanicoccus sagamiensis]|uniref:Lipoprotein n=1 Tax=Oceanicoccus sagamiensis TaxID=716816 RepID=A0A1X9NBA6_9GAMM|nr:DUF6491 family protein [Oceanicoccus sagamiensis]ARN74324.1 hypothetical protein BST96_09420 [Oceanicoccus sagamiensis]